MKRTTLLVSLFLATVAFTNAQTNLVSNPGFETWGETLPDPWYIVSKSVTGVTPAASTTIFAEGAKSLKIDATAASSTFNMSQGVTIVPGHEYTFSAKCYVESGDGTDARLWCNFKKDATTYFTEDELIATGLYATLRSGNENSSGSSYLGTTIGSWFTATGTFTAPADAVGFDFQFRTYKKAVVYWDDMQLIDNSTSGIISPKAESLKVWTDAGKIKFHAVSGEKVEIFNAVGQSLYRALATDGINSVSVKNQGVSIVKVGNRIGKVVL
ncbi:MAG TPA: carbohydrate binding domain-containing protein [Paludibacteraceae bacterium]|nr:carbohydrate binding domain-containing protein [Paludibacteraceae bacterium]